MPPIEPINDTTFEVTLSGGDKVEIGDKESVDFKPHIKLNRWGGECFIKVQPANLVEEEEIEYEVEDDKIKVKYKVKQGEFEEEWETEFYPLEPRTVIAKDKDGNDVEFTQNELGAFEFEVILNEKPTTNKIVLNIETQGLKFYYQPPLTQEEIDEGFIRPDNVVGSYAVYHATRTNMHNNKADAEKYKCGIAFHIYRPKIEDVEGKWVWGELHYDEQAGTLTTTISQEFLDTAIYPIRHVAGETFGYETSGAAGANLENFISGHYATPTDGDGEADYLKIYLTSTTVPRNIKGAIYANDKSAPIANGVTEERNLRNDPGGWEQFNFEGTKPSVVNNTEYILVGWAQSTTGSCFALFNSGTGGDILYQASHVYNGFPEPVGGSKFNDYSLSAYCSYTPTAGGVDYPIGLSVGLTASATIDRDVIWDRAMAPGLTISATIVAVFGRLITTIANLTASAILTATETLRPNTGGDDTNLTIGGDIPAGTNYESVDEVGADDDTTYVYKEGTGYLRDLYNIGNSSGSGTINFITIYARCKFSSGIGNGWVLLAIKSGTGAGAPDTVDESAGFAVGDSYSNFNNEWTTNPATGSAWTWDEIDNLQIGVSLEAALAKSTLCTQVYVEVNYSVSSIVRTLVYNRTTLPGLTVAVSILKGWGMTITTTVDLVIGVTIAIQTGWTIATSAGLTATVSILKGWGRAVATSTDLTISATVSRKVAFTRALSTDLTASITVLKGWGRTITTTAAGFTVSATVIIQRGKKITLSLGLTVSATVAYLIAFGRALSSGITASVTVAKKVAYNRAVQAGLTLAVTILKGWGRSIAMSPGLTVSTTILKGWGRTITISPELTISITLLKGWGRKITTSTDLAISTTINKVTAFKRAVSANLMASVTIVKVFGRLITTTTGLAVNVLVDKVVAYTRSIQASVSLAVAVSVARIADYSVTTITNLTALATVVRTAAYTRATSSGLVLNVSVTIAGIWEWIRLTLLSRIFTFTLPSRAVSLTLSSRSPSLTLIARSQSLTLNSRSWNLTLTNIPGR